MGVNSNPRYSNVSYSFVNQSHNTLERTNKLVSIVEILCLCIGLISLWMWTSKKKWQTKSTNVIKNIPRVSWFSSKFSFLDGFYTPFKLRNDGVKVFEELTRKHGTIYEMSFGNISGYVVSDVQIIKKVLTSNSEKHLNKPKYIYDKIFENMLSQGLFVADYQIWKFHRTVANRAFTYKHLKVYLKIINGHAKTLVQKLQNKFVSLGKDDMVEMHEVSKLIDFHALGIMSEILWGPMYYNDDINQNVQRNIHRAKEIIFYRLMHPELFIDLLWKLHPKKWELDRLWCKLTLALQETIDTYKTAAKNTQREYRTKDSSCDDVGEKPFRFLIEEMLCSGMSDNAMFTEIGTILIAGFETTVVSMNMLMFHLALNPDVQARCWEEVDSLMNAKQGVGGALNSDWELTMEDLANLKYLERCCLESLRLTTAAPVFSRRLDAPLKINEELEFKAGQVVVLLPWVLHRDSQHYQDPLKFDPDRFLPENVKARDPYAFIPFSGGSRNCIGNKFAMMELKTLLAFILCNFEIYTVDRLEDMKFFIEASLRPEREIKMSFKRRS